MKKILLISPYFYPNINPRPYRWTKIAEHWAEHGHEVHVVCEKRGISPDAKIIVHGVGYAALKSFLPERRGEVAKKAKQSPWKSTFFQWINDNIWKKIYFPDDSCIWYFSARSKALDLLQKEDFDLLITSALPFTAHCVGLAVKKKFPNLTWIADTGDPFSLQKEMPLNNIVFYKKWNNYFEKKVLQKADSVTFTTENCLNIYKNSFPSFIEKYHVIPPLLSLSEHFENIEKPNDECIDFAYFGKFYQKVREPKSLIDFYERIIAIKPEWEGRLKIHIYGEVFEVFKQELSKSYIVLHGLIPREEVAKNMQKINFLINISNITDYQLPSKAPDYLFSGKPIVNLFSTKKDAFADFFKDYPLIFNLHHDEKNHQSIVNFIKKNKDKKLQRAEIRTLSEPYSLEVISQMYEKYFIK